MKKIKRYGTIEQIDYVLEDGTELFTMDWNGEIYTNGLKELKDTNKRYRPIYNKINDDEYEVIGFEEI